VSFKPVPQPGEGKRETCPSCFEASDDGAGCDRAGNVSLFIVRDPAVVALTRSVKFGRTRRSSFGTDVRRAVLDWFQTQGISPKANRVMVFKTIALVSGIAAAYGSILASGVPWSARWCSCVLLGLGLASLGMAIGHDALHGAYSNRPWVNRLLGLAFDVAGANGRNRPTTDALSGGR